MVRGGRPAASRRRRDPGIPSVPGRGRARRSPTWATGRPSPRTSGDRALTSRIGRPRRPPPGPSPRRRPVRPSQPRRHQLPVRGRARLTASQPSSGGQQSGGPAAAHRPTAAHPSEPGSGGHQPSGSTATRRRAGPSPGRWRRPGPAPRAPGPGAVRARGPSAPPGQRGQARGSQSAIQVASRPDEPSGGRRRPWPPEFATPTTATHARHTLPSASMDLTPLDGPAFARAVATGDVYEQLAGTDGRAGRGRGGRAARPAGRRRHGPTGHPARGGGGPHLRHRRRPPMGRPGGGSGRPATSTPWSTRSAPGRWPPPC